MQNKGFLWVAGALAVVLVAGAVIYPQLADNYQGGLVNQLDEQSHRQEDGAASSADDAPVIAPDFTVYDADGGEVHLSDFAGQPVVLNFWATWCGPCKVELPGFQAVYDECGDEVAFLFINLTDGMRETVEGVGEFLAENGYTIPVYYDMAGDAAATYGAHSIPATALINADGEIVGAQIGMVDEDTLRDAVLSMLSLSTKSSD